MTGDVIQTILAAIPSIREESERLNKKYGIDPTRPLSPGGEGAVARMSERNVSEDKLRDALFACDEKSLLKAVAVMYYGRDFNSGTFQQVLEELRSRHYHKHELVRTMLEKWAALPQYFTDAEAKLKGSGLSLGSI
jgi:hypothetical protein